MEDSPLDTLPGELRNPIYKLVLISPTAVDILPTQPLEPALTRTCKKIRHECRDIFWSENEFRIDICRYPIYRAGGPIYEGEDWVGVMWHVEDDAAKDSIEMKLVDTTPSFIGLSKWLKVADAERLACVKKLQVVVHYRNGGIRESLRYGLPEAVLQAGFTKERIGWHSWEDERRYFVNDIAVLARREKALKDICASEANRARDLALCLAQLVRSEKDPKVDVHPEILLRILPFFPEDDA